MLLSLLRTAWPSKARLSPLLSCRKRLLQLRRIMPIYLGALLVWMMLNDHSIVILCSP